MRINDQALPYYLELQNRMFDIFLYVTCHEKNFGTYSIKIESLFVDVCSFFDSLCQSVICELHTQGYEFTKQSFVSQFVSKTRKSKFFNINDYRLLLESDFEVSNHEIGLNAYDGMRVISPKTCFPDKRDSYLIRPFEEWAHDNNPDWWHAYTRLKHDRLCNHSEATLGNCIAALGGVFIVISHTHSWQPLWGSKHFYDLFLPWYSISGYDIRSPSIWPSK